MIIPWQKLSDEALRNVIHEFVTRDGTELTDAETKIQSVRKLLEANHASIHFDEKSGTCQIVKNDE